MVNINPEPEECYLDSAICNIFSCQKFFYKTATELPKHVNFRLTSDEPIHANRPSSFPEFDFKSTYKPEFVSSEELIYQITVPLSTEPEPIPDNTCP